MAIQCNFIKNDLTKHLFIAININESLDFCFTFQPLLSWFLLFSAFQFLFPVCRHYDNISSHAENTFCPHAVAEGREQSTLVHITQAAAEAVPSSTHSFAAVVCFCSFPSVSSVSSSHRLSFWDIWYGSPWAKCCTAVMHATCAEPWGSCRTACVICSHQTTSQDPANVL